jgi:chorismate dehydratase
VVTTPTALQAGSRSGEAAARAVLRLGAVSYLNVEPMIWGLDADPRFRLEREVPALVAERLHAGEIDLATIPSVEYAFGDYAIVPRVAIGSRGPVRSVCLFHRVPLDTIRTVALDTSSRTSVALLRVLLQERLGRQPEYRPQAPRLAAMLATADAALLIGDPALAAPAEVPRLDLGEAWSALTGLPFVYAFWAGRRAAAPPDLVRALVAATREGERNVDAIAAREPERAALRRAYLTECIRYGLGESELAGLREFFRRAHALGLVPRLPELRFHADS